MSRKPQTLNYVNGYAVPGEKAAGLAPVAPEEPSAILEADAPPESLPAWVAYDRKVRFPESSVTPRWMDSYGSGGI